MNGRSLFLDALRCENRAGRPPVWLMRQAGRYMPAYRAIRQKHSFLEMCHTPELIAEITELPIKRFGFDAAILFSDILVIPEALGLGLHFEEGRGPIIHRPIETKRDILALTPPDMSRLEYVRTGVQLTKKALSVPLIGFCGAPFTVASYMIEGGSSRDLKKTKRWMVQDPEGFHHLLSIIADWSKAYLKLQIDAGVDAVQIFDSWACYLAYPQFREFSLAYMQSIMEFLKPTNIPVILFCKGSSVFAPSIAKTAPAAIGIDWSGDLGEIRQTVGPKIALQGNLDPDMLYAPRNLLQREVNSLLERMSGDPGFIFNLGHGIHPDVSEEAVETLVETIRCRGK